MKNAKRKILFIALMVVVILSMSGIAISAGTAINNVKDEALDIAVADAGVSRDEIFDVEIEIERKRGTKVVEIEFETVDKDYEYHIV